ncbi:MAG: altronate dehydratase small subunit, partial [Mesotoga sp.]|nr:altronate dehydratase small subunit [Mesotoga sp.]
AVAISKNDNVATLLDNVDAGEEIEVSGDISEKVVAREAINRGHKISLREIDEGEDIIKYGVVIGVSTKRILEGHHVHTHNVIGKKTGN